jgi:muramidase (phage lysozyme)
MEQELEKFYMQLPPELQKKINAIQDEQQKMEVLSSLYQRYLQTQGQAQGNPQTMGQDPKSLMGRYGIRAEEGVNPNRQQIDVEAERNENITVQDGMIVPTKGGYLQELSKNPITGQSTYEIPNNKDNQTHEEGGVDTILKEGDVVNSDKTKIPFDFKIGKSNFKNKTFKEASDKISTLEKKAEKDLNYLVEKGKADDITEQSFEMNFAKYGKMREELNTLQESVLEVNKQIEGNKETNSILARYGTNVKAYEKAENNYYDLLEGYSDKKRGIKKEHIYKAEKGLNASVSNLQEVIDYARAKNLNPREINDKIISTGILSNNYNNSSSPKKGSNQKSFVKPFSYNPSSDTIQQFKDVIASQESKSYKNPYMAIGGLKEQDAMVPFEDTKGKRASSAIGKYQFLWTTWKNDIKKQTGIEDPDEFRNNPSAQEQFMDWYTKNDLMPKAIKAKQKYQIPMNVYEIMGAMHLEGEDGFIKKYNSGQMNKSTMAGKFKNASTEQYSGAFSQFPEEQGMRYGGKLYAKDGIYASFDDLYQDNFLSDEYYEEDLKNIKEYADKDKRLEYLEKSIADNPEFLEKFTKRFNFDIGSYDYLGKLITKDEMKSIIESDNYPVIFKNYWGNYKNQRAVKPGDLWDYSSHIYNADPKNEKENRESFRNLREYNTPYYSIGDSPWDVELSQQPKLRFTGNLKQENFPLMTEENYLYWRDYVQNISYDNPRAKEARLISDKYKNPEGSFRRYGQDKIFGKVHEALYPGFQELMKNKEEELARYNSKENLSTAVTPELDPIYDGGTTEEVTITPKEEDLTSTSTSTTPTEGVGYKDESGKWWEKLNYGVNKSLPYANALSLLMEKKINPTLQQKRARYTPLNTDIDVQPQMNEIQRMYNMNQSDSRGNPSLRAARLAQIASNATGNTNQVLSGKYNQEQQLENQEILRRDSYFNNLDDYNRQLMKQYETEVLQTDENARQQRRGAADYMANLKLRESEQNKATALGLSNTIYDYDPVTGKLVRNPMKAQQDFMQKKLVMEYQNLLTQKQAAQEALLKSKDKDESKPLEEKIKDLEKQLKDLSPDSTGKTVKKKYGGKIKKENKKSMSYDFSSY